MTDIVQNFGRAAEDYDKFSQPQAAFASALAEIITPEERRGRAIEFGAGTALFTRQMMPWNGVYLATDAAARMVEIGRSRCPSASWKVMDANTTTGLGPADWIFACNLLQWLETPEVVLQSWRKLLAPGGQLAVAILLEDTFCELQELLPAAQPLRWRSAEAWRALVEQAGFGLERAEHWRQTSIHTSALDLLRGIHGMGLAPQRLSSAGKLRTALRTYDQRFAAPGGVRATWQGWLARARAV
jgi:malonyl-CoA O-methyltransferase